MWGLVSYVLGLLLLALTFFGVQTLYVSLTSGGPISDTCSHYLSQDPPGLILRLHDCYVDVSRLVQIRPKSKFATESETEYYVPVLSSREENQPIKLLVKLDDSGKELASKLFIDDPVNENVEAFGKLFDSGIVRGLVEVGLDDDSKSREALERSHLRLATNWKVLRQTDDMPTPSWVGALEVIPACAIGAFLIFGVFLSRADGKTKEKLATALASNVLPNSARTIDIHPFVIRYKVIAAIGAIYIGSVLLFMAIGGITILQYSTIGVPIDLVLSVAWLLVNVGLAVRIRTSRYALPLTILVTITMLCITVFQIGRYGLSSDNYLIPISVSLLSAVAAIVILRLRTIAVPELNIADIDVSRRPAVHRPGIFASGRYLSVSFYIFVRLGALGLAAVTAGILFGLTEILRRTVPFPVVPNLLGIFKPYLVLPLLMKSVDAARLQHKYSSATAEAVLAKDNRGIVLLLRSFRDDEISAFGGPIRSAVFNSDLTFEELITYQLWGFGPVVAVGRPGEPMPPAGAAREYVSNDVWQTVVGTLTESASLIVMILGSTSGFGWELRSLAERKLMHKVLLVMPPIPRRDLLRRWQALTDELGADSMPATFSTAALVPNALCAVGRRDGFVVLRARDSGSIAFGVAIDLGARAIISLSGEGSEETPIENAELSPGAKVLESMISGATTSLREAAVPCRALPRLTLD